MEIIYILKVFVDIIVIYFDEDFNFWVRGNYKFNMN